MFDNEIVLFISESLIAASLGCAVAFIALLIINRSRLESEEWRDPQPIIFRIFKPLVQLFSHHIRMRMGQTYFEKIHQKIGTAGMTYTFLPEELVTLRFIFCALATAIAAFIFNSFDSIEARMLTLGIPVLGFFYPDIWLKDRITTRRTLIEKQFPFLMDLLILSMKAGLNYATSLAQTVDSLPQGPVKDEFSRYLRELKAGKNRREALLGLAKRVDVSSVSNFVAALNQADETGGEIGEVLKAQAIHRRIERFNLAEKKANQAPVKLLFPLVLFLFPVLFMIIAFVMAAKAVESGIAPQWMATLLGS